MAAAVAAAARGSQQQRGKRSRVKKPQTPAEVEGGKEGEQAGAAEQLDRMPRSGSNSEGRQAALAAFQAADAGASAPALASSSEPVGSTRDAGASATGSAAAAVAAAAAAAGATSALTPRRRRQLQPPSSTTALRSPSPPLPFLDFDLGLGLGSPPPPPPPQQQQQQPQQDLQPSDFAGMLQRQQAQHAASAGQQQQGGDAELADDLADWLDSHLAAERQATRRQRAADQPQLQQVQQQQVRDNSAQHWHAAGLVPVGGAGPAPGASLAQGQLIMQSAPLFDPLAASGGGFLAQQQQQQQFSGGGLEMGLPWLQPAPPPSAAATMAAPGPAATLATVSVKLFGCTPAELPLGLRDQLKWVGAPTQPTCMLPDYLPCPSRPCIMSSSTTALLIISCGLGHPLPRCPLLRPASSACPTLLPLRRTWFDGAVHALDGYLRPGCVHLTVQALLDGCVEAVAQREREQGQGQQQQQELASASAAAAGGCCGRKRAAEGPAEAGGATDGAVRRVVERMLQSGMWAVQPGVLVCREGSGPCYLPPCSLVCHGCLPCLRLLPQGLTCPAS